MGKKGVMMQYFEWYLKPNCQLWRKVKEQAEWLANVGFSALWLPPAYKGQAGINDVGYGVYDLYDLGEFDQKGSISTKYGTKEEYLTAIDSLHKAGIAVYADMVFNHKMGADEAENVEAIMENGGNRYQDISPVENITAWTKFTFPKRNGKYSDFTWNESHFDGVDFDDRNKKCAIYRLKNKTWEPNVDPENGNYDYLMGADLDFDNPEVVEELHRYGKWYLKMCPVDGFRLDALKHIKNDFFKAWLSDLRTTYQKELFTVGEYWSSNLATLQQYLDVNDYALSLFDVPLHFHFYEASKQKEAYDMSKLLDQTLMQTRAMNAVTFVENHDTQKGQALETIVEDWFKPLAYAVILLRVEGYPCVFYGDYYGIEQYQTKIFRDEIDQMIYLRQNKMNGICHDYFDDYHIVGWTFEGEKENDGLAVVINNGEKGHKKMKLGQKNANSKWYDITHPQNEIILDENGEGTFFVEKQNYAIYIKKAGIL